MPDYKGPHLTLAALEHMRSALYKMPYLEMDGHRQVDWRADSFKVGLYAFKGTKVFMFPPTIEIKPEEGFDPKKDIFSRASLGQGLTNLVEAATEPLVIAVDGQWGSGKTTFLKMWSGELRKANFPVVFFDAFAHDYLDDAFSAIAGEIIALIKEKKKLSTPSGKRFVDDAVKVGKIVARSAARIVVKVATANVLDGTELDGIKDEFEDATGEIADAVLDDLLTKRQAERDAIEAFRQALSKLPAALIASKSKEAVEQRPLIFIIDELDRCRPTFALAILERMKHFFSVQNVHFVLGVNAKQLCSAISLTYGSGIDANDYLQKFIMLYFFLYDKADSERERSAAKFVEYLSDRMKFDQGDEAVREVLDIIKTVAAENDLSLRVIERVMTNLRIALTYIKKNSVRIPEILGLLVIMKAVDPQAYARAKRGIIEIGDVERYFRYTGDGRRKSRQRDWVEKWWRYAITGAGQDVAETLPFGVHFDSPMSIVTYFANDVIDRFSSG